MAAIAKLQDLTTRQTRVLCTILGRHQQRAATVRGASSLAQTCKAGRQRYREIQPRPDKLRLAAEIRDLFCSNKMVAVLSYFDMKNVEWNELIYEVGKSGINFRFLPNKIVHRALDNTDYINLCPLFTSTTVVACSQDVEIKGLLNALKGQRKVQLLGGKVNNRLFGTEMFAWVSKLPLIEQLQQEISTTLSQPPHSLEQLLMKNQQILTNNLEMITSEGKKSRNV